MFAGVRATSVNVDVGVHTPEQLCNIKPSSFVELSFQEAVAEKAIDGKIAMMMRASNLLRIYSL